MSTFHSYHIAGCSWWRIQSEMPMHQGNVGCMYTSNYQASPSWIYNYLINENQSSSCISDHKNPLKFQDSQHSKCFRENASGKRKCTALTYMPPELPSSFLQEFAGPLWGTRADRLLGNLFKEMSVERSVGFLMSTARNVDHCNFLLLPLLQPELGDLLKRFHVVLHEY